MNNFSKKEIEFDLVELVSVVWNRKWLILMSVIVSILIAIVYLRLTPKVYQADLLLKIEKNSRGIGTAILGNLNDVFDNGNSEVDTQIKIINSRAILGETVDEFNLETQLEPYLQLKSILYPPKPIPKTQITFRINFPDNSIHKSDELTLHIPSERRVSLYDGDQLILEGEQGKSINEKGYHLFFDSNANLLGEIMEVVNVDRLTAINKLRDNLSITNVDQGSLLELRLTNNDPEYAIEILNNIVYHYVQRNTEAEVGKLAHGVAFIEEQLPLLQSRLEKAEQALTTYQINNETVDLTVEGDTLINALTQIESQLTELELEENNLRMRYTENHPALQTLIHQRQALSNRRAEIEAHLESIPQSAQGFIRLKRDVEVNQAIYLQLLSKLQELKVIKASSVSGVQVIDSAQVRPNPVKPKSSLVIMLACIIGVMFSSLYVLLKHLMHNRIMTIEDITDNTNLEVISTVPESKKQLKHEGNLRNSSFYTDENHILAVADPQDLSVEALRSLRTNLYFSLQSSYNNVILISGPTENVGKSFISSNIAVLFAQSGKRVILINLDMRKGYLDKQFLPQEGKISLSEFLTSTEKDISPKFCIHNTKIPNLDYIPTGEKPQNPSVLLTGSGLSYLFEYLTNNYDIILVDTPPLLPVSDTLELLTFASNIVLVVRQGETSTKELQLAESKIRSRDIEIAGVVINGIQKNKSRGYYSYHYSYNDKK